MLSDALVLKFASLADFETFFIQEDCLDIYIVGECRELLGGEPPFGVVYALKQVRHDDDILVLVPVISIGAMNSDERFMLRTRQGRSVSRFTVGGEHPLFVLKEREAIS